MSFFAVGAGIATAVGAGAGTAAVVGAAAAVGNAAYQNNQQKKMQNKALDAQRTIAEGIEYEPIDIEKLKQDAQNQAIANATASLALERSLTPDVSATREELARQIRTDLERGGELPTDVANRVNQAGRVIGSRSGNVGSTTPLTAALLGLSSMDIIDERRDAASDLLKDNQLPVSGLDPGAIASLEVANNAAQNDFNLAQAGVASNLAQSEANARASQFGATQGLISSLGPAISQIGSAFKSEQQPKKKYDTAVSRKTTGLGLTDTYKPLGGVQPFAMP